MGNGRSGTVYLAYHIELEEYRAVKIVPKSIADYDTFRKEALFLKTLRHPGIPIVYDVEEDTGYSYLIEEYLEGESLYALVKRMGSLSVKAAAGSWNTDLPYHSVHEFSRKSYFVFRLAAKKSAGMQRRPSANGF